MIVAKKRTLGPTLESPPAPGNVSPQVRRLIRPRRSGNEQVHVDITFRLPLTKARDFVKLIRSTDPALRVLGLPRPPQSPKSPVATTPRTEDVEAPPPIPAVAPERASLTVGTLAVNPERHEVVFKGRPVPQLTCTEFDILHLLARQPGRVFTRDEIINHIRGEGYLVTQRSVDVQVAGLRRKLGGAAPQVQTLRGVGYRFRDHTRRA